MLRLLVLLLALSFPAGAQTVRMADLDPGAARAVAPVAEAANAAFARLPLVALTSNIAGICGGGAAASDLARYCTSRNTIYVSWDLDDRLAPAPAAYVMAHMLGHGIQVRHGVADRALAAIRAAPDREAALRGQVTLQVECLAGVLMARAGLARGEGPADWFVEEPFTGPHWGAEPLSDGPAVALGLGLRDDWYRRGRASGDVSSCATEDLGADLLLRAERR